MATVDLECFCGSLKGKLDVPSNTKAFHVKCLCCDCQKFANFLDNEDKILDEHGGSEILQTHPAYIHIDSGENHVACVRIGKRGLFRWYASCCNTPLANTMPSAIMPFAGVSVKWMKFASDQEKQKILGPIIMEAFAKYARGSKPEGAHDDFPKSFIFKIIAFMARGYCGKKFNPHPFFKGGKPVAAPQVI